MKSIIKNLKSSPLFHISLGSKELFHSDFLQWFGENYLELFGQLFIKYVREEPSSKQICENSIMREKNNLDLTFSYENGQEVIIENKVKSIPTKEQLERYSINDDSKNYVLLSLSKPIFFDSNQQYTSENGTIWQYMSYDELKKGLNNIVDLIDDVYHKLIVKDYINFITELIKIDELCIIYEDDTFTFIEEYSELKEIRMHDFYQKRKYELLAHMVYKNLQEKYDENIVEYGRVSNWEKKNKIFVNSGMTRSVGLLEIKYLIANNIVLGIQIQGNSYRKFIEFKISEGFNIEELKHSLLEKKLWFDFHSHILKTYPFNPKGFNKFGKSFYYRSINISSTATLREVINMIISDLGLIDNRKSDIEKILTVN